MANAKEWIERQYARAKAALDFSPIPERLKADLARQQVELDAMEHQRVPFDMRQAAHANLAESMRRAMDQAMVGQLSVDPLTLLAASVLSHPSAELAKTEAERIKNSSQTGFEERRNRDAVRRMEAQYDPRRVNLDSGTVRQEDLRRQQAEAEHRRLSPAAPTQTPKKPIEIPILTFPKRRINLKDVA